MTVTHQYFYIGFHKCASTTIQKKLMSIVPPNYKLLELNLLNKPVDQAIDSCNQSLLDSKNNGDDISGVVYINNYLSGSFYYDAPENAKILKKKCPNAKILISIRSQFDALRSYYFTTTKSGNTKNYNSFVLNLIHNKKLFYYETIQSYIEQFGLENIKVVCVEDFRNNSDLLYSELYDFLAIEKKYLQLSRKKFIEKVLGILC